MSFYLPDGCTQDMLDSRRKHERQGAEAVARDGSTADEDKETHIRATARLANNRAPNRKEPTTWNEMRNAAARRSRV
jgi:hypothetical protein